MGKKSGAYKYEKRQKEIARQKKQEEKRQRHLQKKLEKQGDQTEPATGETPAIPAGEIDAESPDPAAPESTGPAAD